jgi:gluconate 2-dehydrogenase gamma chain
MKRRSFLTLSAAVAGGAGAQVKTVRVPLRFFTEAEALTVAAAAARIFPTDESGPGANEAGVAIYIDRQLAGPYGRDRYRYTQPPFEVGLPEQGYQGSASPREIYREGLKLLVGFTALDPAAQDERLERIETSRFFQLLRQHTIEGMFCDPMHGGNKNLIGWRLIGFPGPYMSWRDEIDQHYGQAFRPKPRSLSQILERPVKPWEDSE